jgi:hypothetical protein
MIIWRGFGILVVVIAGAALVLTQLLGNALFGSGTYEGHSGPLGTLALLLAAAIVWPLGRALNRRGARTLVDPATGQRVVLRPNHSLFFLPMEYWAPILGAGAVVWGLVSLVQG